MLTRHADYAHAFDKGDLKQTGPGKWLTQDYIFVKPTGEKVSGVGKAWDSLMEVSRLCNSRKASPRALRSSAVILSVVRTSTTSHRILSHPITK
jgi:hypothetical protein